VSRTEPEIVTFVSGKGGVGKTMLAVAFARELSHADKTLILDLDFFNRGLTGLLRHGKKIMAVQKPRFLEIEEKILIRLNGNS
jgi:cellulose biosynthesis protein BcsQ